MKCLSHMSRSFLLILLLAFCINSFSQTVIYSESFSSSSGGWSTSSSGTSNGTPTTWFVGSNSSSSTGASGNYFFSEQNGSNYKNNTYIIATSPAINLTGYNSITFELKIWHKTEPYNDGMKIEYSLNNGSSWKGLGSESNSNWYNDPDVDALGNNEDGWSGDSNGWKTKSINLSTEDIGFESATQARFRVLFASDNKTTDTGVAFDEIFIRGITVTPTITTGTISPTTYCSGSSVNVPFTITGTFTSGNVFTAQLSNASGSFASPVSIGTLSGTTSGTISATIPTATTAGNGYRIRVVSSNPVVTGSNNGTNITINSIPTIIGTTSASRCGTGTVTLSATASSGTINWYAASTGGIPLGSGTSFTTPNISSTTTYWVDATNASCTTASRTAVIATINTLPTITGTTPASRCGTGSVTLGATASSGTINWYAASTGGIPLATGTSFTTPSISSTTTYWVDATNGSCTMATRIAVIATINKNYWTGDADTNWNNSANWCAGVPTNGIEMTLNVLIPSGLTNYPVISAGAAAGYVKSIVLENNTILTIIDNSLRVTENLKLDGKIDLEGEAQLLQDLGSILDPTSSGTLERDQQGTADTYTYNYWSSPVGLPNNTTNNNSYKISDIFQGLNFITTGYNGSASPLGIADYWIWKFSNKTSGDYSQWQHVRSTGTLLAGEGFTMKGPGTGSITTPQNYVLLGKPNNGDINLPISAGNEYLVGNPYPSALDADQFIRDNGNSGSGSTTGTLYFWEHWGGGSHILSEYQGGYATYTLAGGVPAASSGTSGTATKTPKQYIPVAQGFFVTSANSGTIKFNNGQRVFQVEDGENSLFIKQLNTKTNKNAVSDTRTKLRLSFNSVNAIKRQLLVTVDSNSSMNYDWGYDAPYIENLKDDAYWMIDSKKYTIQGIDKISESTVIPLGIHTKNDGWNTFNIDAIEYDVDNLNIYLHYKILNTYHNLKESSFKIYLPSGEYLNRFEITFNNNQSLLSTSEVINKNIELYFSNEKESIIINNPNYKEIKTVKINNILGQAITQFNINSTSNFLELKPKNIEIGTYIITLQTDKEVISKKVIIN